MTAPFTASEYDARLQRVRNAMSERELDALIIADPANMNWLTGFDAWSMYVPQVMVVDHDRPPVWMGRLMDAGAVTLTTHLGADSIRPYPEELVQRPDAHPMDRIATELAEMGLRDSTIGYESDTYFFSPRALDHLTSNLPATWVDADLLVNWCRVVKSNAEIAMIRHAARFAEGAMTYAYEHIAPGVRQCDLVAGILAAQVGGSDAESGDLTALPPLILAGAAASTAHPIWTDECFAADQTVALELAGACRRYHAGLARTVQLGQGSNEVFRTATAVEEGLDAVLDTMRPGVTAGEVHRAWRGVLDEYGLVKESRIGYSIGVGYSPDWGEHTVSLRADEPTVLEENMTLHVMLGMWMDGWGMELSETVAITSSGATNLTDFPRAVHLVP